MSLNEPPFRKSPLGDRFRIPKKDTSELGDKESIQKNGFNKQKKEAFGELSRLWRRPKKSKEIEIPKEVERPKQAGLKHLISGFPKTRRKLPQKVKETKEYPGIFKKIKPKKWGAQTYFSRIDMERKMKNDPHFRYEVFNKAKITSNPEKRKQILNDFYERMSKIKKEKFRSGATNTITEKEVNKFAKEFKKLRQYGKKEEKMLGNLGKAIFGEPKR